MDCTRRTQTGLATGLMLALVVAAIPPIAAAEDAFTAPCQVCHGPDGVSRWPDIPNISGLPAVVISNALYDFRGHARPCRQAACGAAGDCPAVDKCTMSIGLSDEDIARFARYYASQPFSPSVAETDPALTARGKAIHDAACEECHTGGGSNPLDEASILRGQNVDYLRNAMEDYRARRRQAEEAMATAKEALSDEDIEALLHFYGSPTK
jgi:sulfide dehydrogenase cytochrome subunit